MLQYFIDCERHVVLTVDGRPVHDLTDENGQHILDDERGWPIIVPIEKPEHVANWPVP